MARSDRKDKKRFRVSAAIVVTAYVDLAADTKEEALEKSQFCNKFFQPVGVRAPEGQWCSNFSTFHRDGWYDREAPTVEEIEE